MNTSIITPIERYTLIQLFITFQYLCRKLAATSLPISKELPIITTDQKAPENKWDKPVILKNAALNATKAAENATKYGNLFVVNFKKCSLYMISRYST